MEQSLGDLLDFFQGVIYSCIFKSNFSDLLNNYLITSDSTVVTNSALHGKG